MNQALHFSEALLPTGWARNVRVTIADGRFAGIECVVPPRPDDQRHTVALPGLPNLHSHAFQRGMAGLAERRGSSADSFWTWREAMYHFLDRMQPHHVAAVAALAYAEMLESGFTRVGEFHYLHHDPAGAAYGNVAAMAGAVAEAAHETGIAMTLLPVFYAHADFGGAAPKPGQRRFICDLESFAQLHQGCGAAIADLADAVLGLAPHSLRAVTAEELAALLALHPAGPVHIHAAEQVAEVEASLAWSGQRPVEWLLDHAPLDPRWCLIHATHTTAAEAKGMAARGVVAGLCPVTEANLGDGIFPALEYRAAGGQFGLGTDSNVLIDASEELRWLEYVQRLSHRGRNLLAGGHEASTGGDTYRAALAGGSQALGAPAGLAEGNPADFLTLDPGHPSLVGASRDRWLDGWIFAAGRSAIDGVWRSGRQVVAAGRHLQREGIVQRYQAVLAELLG
ncbi:formimidoylglutamate deiminase [Novosphingobium sp.]|uniref:formimidoylglutamate deiminase n=1 Tax=Novosphingobium sp. TaxID=1874826 RepID=UPI0025D8A877|nr:formimidoylglutamate deiminase [Novosphingobium sp.]MCC6927070.1 formimidoylglutamate deiminase [Novosphingobium sp.]